MGIVRCLIVLAILLFPAIASAQPDFFRPIPTTDRSPQPTPSMPPAMVRDTEATGIYLSREEAADLFGRMQEHRTLQQKSQEQEQEIAALKKIIELKDQIAALQEEKYQKQVELTALAEKKAEMYRAQVEEVKKDAKGKVRAARVIGFAGAGAALGAVAPPFGPLIGAAIGAGIGFFTDGP